MRSVLVLAALMVACGGGSASRRADPVVQDEPATREPARPAFRVVRELPIVYSGIPGPEGRHSASHSSTDQTGRLAIGEHEVLLELTQTTSQSFVVCPPGRREYPNVPRQACTPEPVPQVEPIVHSYTMRGTMEESEGGFRLALSYVTREGRTQRTEVVCRDAVPEEIFAVDCELDDAWPNPMRHGVHGPTLRFVAR